MHVKLKEKTSNCGYKQTNICFPVIKCSSSEFTNGIKVAKSHVLWPCVWHELLFLLHSQNY